MHPVLRLYEDVLSSAETVEFQLPPLPRFIFVVHGSATIGGRPRQRRRGLAGRRRRAGQARRRRRDLLALGTGARRPRLDGRQRARHGLAREAHGLSRDAAEGRTADARRQRRLPARRLRLSAPAPGAGHPLPDRGRHPHRHARPLDVVRRRAAPGTRPGPIPVFAQAAMDRPSRFIRVMILPRALARQKLDPVSSTKTTRPSRRRSNTRSTPTRRSRSTQRVNSGTRWWPKPGSPFSSCCSASAVFAVLGYVGKRYDKRIAGVLLTFPILNGIGILTGNDPLAVADSIYAVVVFNGLLLFLMIAALQRAAAARRVAERETGGAADRLDRDLGDRRAARHSLARPFAGCARLALDPVLHRRHRDRLVLEADPQDLNAMSDPTPPSRATRPGADRVLERPQRPVAPGAVRRVVRHPAVRRPCL